MENLFCTGWQEKMTWNHIHNKKNILLCILALGDTGLFKEILSEFLSTSHKLPCCLISPHFAPWNNYSAAVCSGLGPFALTSLWTTRAIFQSLRGEVYLVQLSLLVWFFFLVIIHVYSYMWQMCSRVFFLSYNDSDVIINLMSRWGLLALCFTC